MALDHNLANAHGLIGLAKYFLGRGEETEAHIHEALRLSPRDIFAFRWMMWVGIAKVQLNADGEAVAWLRRSIEANRNVPLAHFYLAVALAQLGLLDEARATAQAGLRLDSGFTIRRFRAGAASDNPKFIAGRERMYEGMRRLGYRRARLMSATSHLQLVAVKLDQVEGIQHRLMAPAASRRRGQSRPRHRSGTIVP